MALKLNFPSPIFSPPFPSPDRRATGEIRFSRWNNANAERFNQRRREQEEIEADIRRLRRYDAAEKISSTHDALAGVEPEYAGKSVGTPSSPSAPSIPGKKSKYSKPPTGPKTKNKPKVPESAPQVDTRPEVRVSQEGVSYVIDGAPFEFKYSYTETPKVKPVKLREPYAPFGPVTMGRPWTGSAPLPPSKKKLKEFDSFELPPPGKKGVKPVQKPGPFLPGAAPRYVKTREEILGEPLTKEEVKDLVNGCIKSRRQLHMGRDGFTHNMLDNIHAHWKRRRVCKIKCLGVCTVDMDNVCLQLEEKTCGKVIQRNGGVLFLFRGRNYNYRTRPRFPLMLWRPVTPVYPRLVKRVPEGLTLEEVTEMRRKGRELMPICKLAKNGLYCDLAKDVREAFEVCELVRINCQGINGSDYRKIGAKLKDLVPCVLISFENQHILMWRGRNWKSSLLKAHNEGEGISESEASVSLSSVDSTGAHPELGEEHFVDDLASTPLEIDNVTLECTSNVDNVSTMTKYAGGGETFSDKVDFAWIESESECSTYLEKSAYSFNTNTEEDSEAEFTKSDMEARLFDSLSESEEVIDPLDQSEPPQELTKALNSSLWCVEGASESDVAVSLAHSARESEGSIEPLDLSGSSQKLTEAPKPNPQCMEVVLLLMKQAVENGNAFVLDQADLDADVVFKKAVDFGMSAMPGPVFRQNRRKLTVQKSKKQETKAENSEVRNESVEGSEKGDKERPRLDSKLKRDYLGKDYRDVVPEGSLRVDELAKLLA